MNGIANKKLFLLDMDGTLYLGNQLFDGTLAFLDGIRKMGGRYLFLTNNSSKSVDRYVEKLLAMGITATADDFMTSTQVTIQYLLKHYKNKKIYGLGTKSFKEELKKAGLCVVDSLDEGICCLVMGFDTELTFQKLEDACILLNQNVDYIATNPDLVCPTEFGYVPDCGSVSGMLYHATKRKPLFIGKPQPEMVYYAMTKTGFTKEETILIGDRIYTDIACGLAANISTALVLSGETTLDDVTKSEQKPHFIFKDVKELYYQLKKWNIFQI